MLANLFTVSCIVIDMNVSFVAKINSQLHQSPVAADGRQRLVKLLDFRSLDFVQKIVVLRHVRTAFAHQIVIITGRNGLYHGN